MADGMQAETVLRGGPVLDLSDWQVGDRATPEWMAACPRALAVRGGEIVALG